jgi:hypothetical protein
MSKSLTDTEVGILYREACNEPSLLTTLNEYELNKLFKLNSRIIERRNIEYVEICLINEHRDTWAVDSKRVHAGLLSEPLALKKRITYQLQQLNQQLEAPKKTKSLSLLIKKLTESQIEQIRETYIGKKPSSTVPLLIAMKEEGMIEQIEFENFKALCESLNIWLNTNYSNSAYHTQHTHYCNKVQIRYLTKIEFAKNYLKKLI